VKAGVDRGRCHGPYGIYDEIQIVGLIDGDWPG
jgi:hypothetical protein